MWCIDIGLYHYAIDSMWCILSSESFLKSVDIVPCKTGADMRLDGGWKYNCLAASCCQLLEAQSTGVLFKGGARHTMPKLVQCYLLVFSLHRQVEGALVAYVDHITTSPHD